MTKNRRLWFLAGLFILLLAWGVNDSNSFKLVDNGNQNWKTIKLTSEKLSLQTPPQWSISEDETESNKPPQNIVLLSPTINGYFFSLEVSSGSSQDVYPDFLGVGQAKNLTNLNTANAPTSLYVAAKLSGENVGCPSFHRAVFDACGLQFKLLPVPTRVQESHKNI
jgi:hypothetical protein